MSGSSFVFYRFKSQREPSRIAFDGTGISVWDLKKEIIADNKMGKGADFDFAIYNADTEEEYTNDYALIPRSTSVLARRLPPSKPGRGNAQQYMASNSNESGGPGLQAGRGAAPDPKGGVGGSAGGQGYNKEMFSKRFDGREDISASKLSQAPSSVQIPAAAPTDEASAMAAMFAATNSQWEQTQEQMAHATPVYRAPLNGHQARPQNRDSGGGGSGGGNQGNKKNHDYTHKPPPPGYICYRCGQKGHWIQDCPTNGDAAYENRPRIKRTTGIPKSFLTEVAGPGPKDEGEGGEGGMVMDHKSGVMVTADGGFVVARPDNASWFAHRARTANLSASDVQNLAPTDPDLTCPICSKLLREAVLTPCCSTSFCDECVSNALLDNDMLCPECETRVKNLEKLKPDEGRRERAKKYVEEMVEASKEAAELEKAEREREEERRRKEEEKKREEAEKEAAANGIDIKAELEIKNEEPTPVKEENVEVVKGEEQEELFPAKPQEILNPRKPRNVSPSPTPAPASTEMNSNVSQSSSTVQASSPSSAPSASSMPLGLNAAQQAQFLRQQQLRAQQQQQMMAMQMGLPNPQMIQQQMFQLSAMLQNPSLPPPMRMNLQGQMQQCQMMLMQFQQRMAAMGMQQQQQFRANGGSMSPQMVHGMSSGGGGAGQKRQREEGANDGESPVAKR
ncbi:cleavage polyadenylation factor subunit MPE1 [Sporobolomyces salmoneus]|uniref:cleavage polyadenylation factor subunit MPE1 n=1 Tax=Sporobolomyces salmoneus TaxID=183962 RepID=UPI00318086F9